MPVSVLSKLRFSEMWETGALAEMPVVCVRQTFAHGVGAVVEADADVAVLVRRVAGHQHVARGRRCRSRVVVNQVAARLGQVGVARPRPVGSPGLMIVDARDVVVDVARYRRWSDRTLAQGDADLAVAGRRRLLVRLHQQAVDEDAVRPLSKHGTMSSSMAVSEVLSIASPSSAVVRQSSAARPRKVGAAVAGVDADFGADDRQVCAASWWARRSGRWPWPRRFGLARSIVGHCAGRSGR